MSGTDFMGGFREPPPQPLPRPSIGFGVPADWKHGQSIMLRPVFCCPNCGSPDVRVDNSGKTSASDHIDRWECGNCQKGFKLPKQPRQRCWYPG